MGLLGSVLGFFGWKWLIVLAFGYGCCLIGANSPATFKRSRAGLEKIANDLLAKAKEKALRGG